MINERKNRKNSKSGIRSLGLGICSGMLAIGVFFNSIGISEAALVNGKDKSQNVKLTTIPREKLKENLMERELMKKPYERAIIRSDKEHREYLESFKIHAKIVNKAIEVTNLSGRTIEVYITYNDNNGEFKGATNDKFEIKDNKIKRNGKYDTTLKEVIKFNNEPQNAINVEYKPETKTLSLSGIDKIKNISSIKITGPEYVVATFNKSDFDDRSKKEDDKELNNFLKYDTTTGNITIDVEKQYDKIRITKDGTNITEIKNPLNSSENVSGIKKINNKWVITSEYYKGINKIKVEILKSIGSNLEQKIGTQEIDILKEKEKAELEKEKPKENQPKVETPKKELPKKEDKEDKEDEETEEQIRRRKERERREDETARDRRKNQNQKYKKGWNKVSEKWYYTNDGVKFVRSSWIYDEGYSSWYYLNEYGEMTSNKWVQYSDGSWYYLLENGKMAVSKWVKHTDNNWYYLLGNGKMAFSEWVKHTNRWYYLLENGKMAKSEWVYDKKYVSWYYFNNGGDMAANKWIQHTDNNWYYLLGNGKMAKSTTINGWYVDANGIWKNR
ncbi:hypothetical protein ABGF38_03075 [Helcococcus ovis]|uniref:hypothetical protein n=1 Tax=Helcococcus ovis TaxID=72026 RepID=UPI0038BCE78C